MGLPIDDKEKILECLVLLLEHEHVPYALIGGVAVQLYTEDPRTTADIDVAVPDRRDIPRAALLAAGFDEDGVHQWSVNWRGPAPSGTPRRLRVAVQFSAGTSMARAATRAEDVSVGKFFLKLASLPDLMFLKLEAASEPTRRASKRSQDLTDVMKLIEEHPELDSSEIRETMSQIRSKL